MQRERTPNEIEEKIFEIIKSSPMIITREISRKLDVSYPTALKHLSIMEAKGVIKSRTFSQTKAWELKDNAHVYKKIYPFTYSSKEGILKIGGIEACMIMADSLVDIIRDDLPRKVKELYDIGFKRGSEYGKLLRGYRFYESIYDTVLESYSLNGFGKLVMRRKIIEKNKFYMEIDCKNSLIGRKIDNVGYPVDSYLLGSLAGVFSSISDKHIIGEEKMCIAKGDEICKYIFYDEGEQNL